MVRVTRRRLAAALLSLALMTATAACDPFHPHPAPTVEPHPE